MGPQPGDRLVIPRLPLDLLDLDAGVRQRTLRLELVTSVFGVCNDVVVDPVVEEAFDFAALSSP